MHRKERCKIAGEKETKQARQQQNQAKPSRAASERAKERAWKNQILARGKDRTLSALDPKVLRND
jgi:hypothetical protein